MTNSLFLQYSWLITCNIRLWIVNFFSFSFSFLQFSLNHHLELFCFVLTTRREKLHKSISVLEVLLSLFSSIDFLLQKCVSFEYIKPTLAASDHQLFKIGCALISFQIELSSHQFLEHNWHWFQDKPLLWEQIFSKIT